MQTTHTKTTHTKKGFTVVEAIVAIGILMLVVSGGFTAGTISLNRSILSKEQVIAFYLAQEGMELVRNVRDNNGLQGNNWLDGLTQGSNPPCPSGDVCRVDATVLPSGTWTRCGSAWGSCPVLRSSGNPNYLFGYNGAWSPTIFTREIKITETATDEISVEVRVTWNHGGTPEQFVANGLFYNWH